MSRPIRVAVAALVVLVVGPFVRAEEARQSAAAAAAAPTPAQVVRGSLERLAGLVEGTSDLLPEDCGTG